MTPARFTLRSINHIRTFKSVSSVSFAYQCHLGIVTENPSFVDIEFRGEIVAKKAIDKGWDMRIPTPQRQFFYLPLMHSECLADQDRAVRMIKSRMEDHSNLLHAKAHREIIRRFGRFPYRNDALSRTNTAEEAAFLADGGYGAMVKELQAEAA